MPVTGGGRSNRHPDACKQLCPETQWIVAYCHQLRNLGGANINDARAAYVIWIDEVMHQFGHPFAETVPGIFVPSSDIVRGIRQGNIDCFGVTALEYVKVLEWADPNFLVLQDYLADGIEYVLLVHAGSSMKTIADLRGAQIVSHLHRDMALLPAWLSIMLAANNLGAPERFFAGNSPRDTVNQVVLPVFFRRVDGACLARRSWEMAVELNPQLGRDVRILAVSPRIVPIAIGFRRNLEENARKGVIDSMLRISTTTAGRQITAFYGTHGFIARPASAMKATVEMVRQYERLSVQQDSSRKERP